MPTGVEAPKVKGERKPRAEVLTERVVAHTRTWVDHPSGDGFFTLDRTQGFGDLVVTSYLFNPKDRANRFDPKDRDGDSAVSVLSDWKYTSHPSAHINPSGAGDVGETQVRFVREWSREVPAGRSTTVEALRGQTPVRMVFQAA